MPNTLESLTKMGFSDAEAQNILSATTPEQVESLIKKQQITRSTLCHLSQIPMKDQQSHPALI